MAVFAVPGDLAAPTGGYAYARRILQALPGLVHLPLPDPPDRALIAVPRERVLLIDGLTLGTLPVRCLDQIRAPIVGLVHHPLCLETGLSAAEGARLFNSERVALARCARVIATSETTAHLLNERFAVPRERLAIAEPGTDPAPRAPCAGDPPHLLAVGAVVPRKGYDALIAALGDLRAIAWRLTIVGTLDRDRVAVASLRAAIARGGLAGRVTLAGAVDSDALDRLYASADVFVVASHYEGYGMAAAEALARGLPLVASTGGALAATVPQAAALTFTPGDGPGLCAALHRMLTDGPARLARAEAAWVASRALPRWTATAARVAEVMNSVVIDKH